MKWQRGYRSEHVVDRRGQGGGLRPNLGMMLPIASRFGWKGIAILFVLLLVFGGVFGGGLLGGGGSQPSRPAGTPDDATSFVGFVLDDVQKTWHDLFAQDGRNYQPADVVLFTGSTSTRCGFGSAAVGPFYCPRDRDVYIDLHFYAALRDRFGAPGDFAQAYVIAHEIGHHVQNQLGLTDRVHGATSSEQTGASGFSVRLELQADCFAGVWAASSKRRDLLDPGDIEEALRAAAAIGDDTLQRRQSGTVQPESWTHGSSAQRVHWFQRGAQRGDPDDCDTFGTEDL